MIKKIIILGLLISASIAQAQIFFSDDFNDSNLNGWTNIDDDTDSPTSPGIDYDLWYVSDIYSGFVTGLEDAAAVSHSLGPNGSSWVAYNPNNFLVSPPIDLSTALSSNLKLKFNAGSGQVTGGHAEHYAVYVTTTNTIADITAATPVFEQTLPTGEEMFSHIIDISSYSGQTVYVTFRHYDCSGQFILLIDDVIVEQVLSDNVSVNDLSLNRYSMMNIDNTLAVNITNNGANTITSLTIDWNDGASHSSTISGLNIAQFASSSISHPTFVNYSSIIEKEISVTITEVNGQSDSDPTDNSATANFNTISQQSTKNVLFEEGTGTWCPGCPGGTVVMDEMSVAHPSNFIGIAVHVREDDPMNIPEYELAADFFSAPSLNVDRTLLSQDIFSAETLYNQQITLEVPAELSATITGSGSSLTIEASSIFRTTFSNANLRFAVIIIEDHVTGTTSEYDQANAYAGGAYGDMGDFDELPNPVPASQMEYNHVGRALLGGYNGQENSVPTSISDGQEITYTFNYSVPSSSNINHMHAIVVLIDQNSGEIINAETASLYTGIEENTNTIVTNIYPNPTSDILNVEFEENSELYSIRIYDIKGNTVIQKEVNSALGKAELNLSNLQKGNYFINISTKGTSTTKKIVVN